MFILEIVFYVLIAVGVVMTEQGAGNQILAGQNACEIYISSM